MRTSPTAMGILAVLVIAVVVASRFSRSLGPVGIIVTIALVIIVAGLARELLINGPRRAARPPASAPPRDVTPREAALGAGPFATSAAGSRSASAGAPPRRAAGSPPTIIVVDPPDGTDQLASKLDALDRLRAEGVVSEPEYEAKRAQLIADF